MEKQSGGGALEHGDESSKEEEMRKPASRTNRIQTAEGWKRRQLKKRHSPSSKTVL